MFFFQPLSAVEFDETDDDVIIDDKVITELRGKLSNFSSVYIFYSLNCWLMKKVLSD